MKGIIMTKKVQPMYSWCGTDIHIPLSVENAEAYNRAVDAFTHSWMPSDIRKVFYVEASSEDIEIYNKVADVINLMVELSGGSISISEEDMTTSHLIRIN